MSEIKAYTDEWLRARKLGSSDAAACLGLDNWRSPWKVWAEKTGRGKPVEETEPMLWGKLLEPVIAEQFSKRTGFDVAKNESMASHPEHDFLTATVDYWCWENEQLGILEIKNVNAFSRDYDEETIADSSHIQVMHQMAVTGLPWAYVAWLSGGNKLRWKKVERDEAFIKRLIEAETKFWRLVETDTPPAMCGQDNDALAELYPKALLQSISIDGSIDLARAYLAAKAEAKAAESRADDYAAKLKAAIGPHEVGLAGSYRVSWKNQVRKSYTVSETTYRKFDVKEIKNNG